MEPTFGLAYLGVGYGLAFLALAGYLTHLARRQRALTKKVDDLARKSPSDGHKD